MGRAKQKRNRKIKKGERVRFDLQNSPKKLDGCLCLMILLSRLVRPKAVFLFTEEKLSFFIRFYRSDTSVIMQYANAGCFPQEYPCRSSTVSAQPLCRNSPVSCADVSVW